MSFDEDRCEPEHNEGDRPAIQVANDLDESIGRIRAALEARVWKGPSALSDRLTLRFVLSKGKGGTDSRRERLGP